MASPKTRSLNSICEQDASSSPHCSPRPRHQPCSSSFVKGLEYNGGISIVQVIECKRRERRIQSSLPKTSSQECREFNDQLFDSVEAFLDKVGMFIVSPTPIKNPRNLLRLNMTAGLKNKTDSYYHQEEVGEVTSIQEISLFQSNSTDLPASENSKRPFLGKVAGSSLFQRRKKFDTMDAVVSVQTKSESDL